MSGKDSSKTDRFDELIDKLEEVKRELPNGELASLLHDVKIITDNQHIMSEDVKLIKNTIMDPESGLIVRVNKNTEFRDSLEAQEEDNIKILEEHQNLVSWKESVTKFLWLIAASILSILSKMFFFN